MKRGKLDRRILEELIFERVKLSVDLCELLTLEADLAKSIDRALTRCSRSVSERAELAAGLMHRAWARAGREAIGHLAQTYDSTPDVPVVEPPA